MRKLLLTCALTLFSSSLAAQDLKPPADWKVRFDRANSDPASHYFVEMPPGWHVTTGPAGIMYNPANTAKGQFRLESKIFTFPTKGRNREAFGVLFGGRDLDGDGQAYMYFLIRNDGNFLVKRRTGSQTSTIVQWTPSAAIVRNESDEENVENVLAVEAGASQVDFYINDEKVASVPRGEIQCDGVVGLRVNHGLNLHVASLEVTAKG